MSAQAGAWGILFKPNYMYDNLDVRFVSVPNLIVSLFFESHDINNPSFINYYKKDINIISVRPSSIIKLTKRRIAILYLFILHQLLSWQKEGYQYFLILCLIIILFYSVAKYCDFFKINKYIPILYTIITIPCLFCLLLPTFIMYLVSGSKISVNFYSENFVLRK